SHFQGLSPRELRYIENRVNDVILRDAALQTKVMGREDALAYGALAFFGDKYGEKVRVVEVPGFSKGFCGGTHGGRTGQIGLFSCTHEGGISAGTRRVEAIWYVNVGYAAQRSNDLRNGTSPGYSTPESQALDAAALYFSETDYANTPGRGGFGGYLFSN